ncbi:MAG: hypothetical protein M3N21_08830 [Actinomycetota bacterium]|nr:hypothetical protein [Actinomycetota bacterium]
MLPRLSDEEYLALRADIEVSGIRVPIDVDEDGNVLDGHHRSWIAAELGIECPRRVVPDLTEDQKRAHAVAVNVHRRNLSREQRDALIVRLREEGLSQRRISEAIGMPQQTVSDRLRQVSDSGRLGQLTESGQLPDRVTSSNGRSYPAKAATQPVSDSLSDSVSESLPVQSDRPDPDKSPIDLTKSRGGAVTAERVRIARQLAEQGYTSSQIAIGIGLTEAGTRGLCRREGITVHADRVVAGTRRLDSNRIVEQTVLGVQVSPDLLVRVIYTDLDRSSIGEWINSLSESLKALRSLKSALEKELSNGAA